MKRFLVALVLSFAVVFPLSFTVASCGKTPPNMTPDQLKAARIHHAVQYLDLVVDAANIAHALNPPRIDDQTLAVIKAWHDSAVAVVKASADGWRSVLLASIDELPSKLPADAAAAIAPYLAAARVILQAQLAQS